MSFQQITHRNLLGFTEDFNCGTPVNEHYLLFTAITGLYLLGESSAVLGRLIQHYWNFTPAHEFPTPDSESGGLRGESGGK